MTPLSSLLLLLPLATLALRREMTVEVAPQAEECFYTPVLEQGHLAVEYQVLNSRGGPGQFGDIDINFRCVAPMAPLPAASHGAVTGAAILLAEYRREEGSHEFRVDQLGDYKICFDNKYSYLNTKTIYFVINTDETEEGSWPGQLAVPDFQLFEEEEKLFDDSAEDIKDKLRAIMQGLATTQQLQSRMRATNSKDRSLAESNFERVNRWSLLFLCLILCSGLLQTVLVRNLFEEPSRLHPVWRRLAKIFQ